MFLLTVYPNAKPVPNNPRELMMLNPVEAGILVILNLEYKDYILESGKMLVEVGTALYGLIDSARLWYELIKSTLIEFGYIQNPYDLCVLNKGSGEDQISIYLHVDDMLVTAFHQKDIDELHFKLQNKFRVTHAVSYIQVISWYDSRF